MTSQSLLVLAKRLMRDRVNFPNLTEGAYSISRYEEPHPFIVNMRDCLFTGLPQTDYPGPITVHKLSGPEGTWMTDMPCELVQMYRELTIHARGTVLIGGLGLGIAARQAVLKKSVSKIIVIERQPEIIKMVTPYLNGKTAIVQADIFEYAKLSTYHQFNVALLDTWQGTDEWAWQTEVVPLRRAIGNKIRHVYCWHEDTMIGQVAQMLYRVAGMPAEIYKRRSTCHYYAFRKGLVTQGIRPETPEIQKKADFQNFQKLQHIEERNRGDPTLRRYVALFLHAAGTDVWERCFGPWWDEAWAVDKV